jgi:hypothetical protein
MSRLAILLILVAGCSRALTGFVCKSDPSCGANRKCIDNSCAVSDPLCASGYHWDDSSGARSGTCTPNGDGGVVVSSCSGVSDGASCGPGEICHAMACVSGCLIGGMFYQGSALNPANECQECDPFQSTSAWSSVAAGTACTGGRCVAGACCTGCVTAKGACQATPTVSNCGVGGAACTSCASGSDCIADSCNSDGTCSHTMLSGNACAGPQCAQGAGCPGSCAQCSQVGTCQSGQCTMLGFVCCPTGQLCGVSGTRARCGGD